jgi:AcrR family transcriptional regulator
LTTVTDNGSPFNRGIQHEAKHGAILSRSAKLFNTKGARSTTLSDVADKLGLTKTSLYYYVKTKEDLIYQCYDAAMRQAHKTLDQVEQTTDDPLERILLFMEENISIILKALSGHGDYYAAPLEFASLKDEHREALSQEYLRMFIRIRSYIRDGIESNVIRPCHSTATARALIGALDWSFYWLYEMPREDAVLAGSALRNIVKHGLFAADGQYRPTDHVLSAEGVVPAKGFDREAQNRLKQEAFFKAGTRFFNRKGFNGTSLDEIAEHLQVSKGAFYYHFTNKEALLTQCYEHSLDLTDAIYTDIRKSTMSAPQKLDTACRQVFHIQNSDLGPLIRYNTITALPPPIRRRVLVRTQATSNNLGQFIREGQGTGEFRNVDAAIMQNMLEGAVNAAMDISDWRRVDDIDQTAVEYFDVFYFGLAKPAN